jgi:hypothetical protein
MIGSFVRAPHRSCRSLDQARQVAPQCLDDFGGWPRRLRHRRRGRQPSQAREHLRVELLVLAVAIIAPGLLIRGEGLAGSRSI